MSLRRCYPELNFPEKEALRYLGYRSIPPTAELLAELEKVRAEIKRMMSSAVCYARVPVAKEDGEVVLSLVRTSSEGLKRNLHGCGEAVLFAATIGIGADRVLARYAHTDPLREAMAQAIGAAYAEELCDEFCRDLARECAPLYTRPRFSPGYGDFPLAAQREFFALLSPEREIGVTLNESLLMSPTKSVTAVVGLSETPCRPNARCADCERTDCAFRAADKD